MIVLLTKRDLNCQDRLGSHWTMPQHNNVNWIKQVFFTSSRVVQYATLEEFSPTQLLADYPFLTDKRTDIVGT
eukprot:COSAG06_NODE_34_length_31045_cov_28.806469_27_plen_73_part_00